MGDAEAQTRVAFAEPTRDELVRGLWPDKALYAGVLLLVTGFVGILTALVQLAVGLSYSGRVPSLIALVPWWFIGVLSLLTFLAATLALRRRSTAWAVRGCVLAFLSLGFLGVNTILALIAANFVLRSWREGEATNPATRVLTADMWPDKALAAALLLLIAGVLTTVWGLAIGFDAVTFDGYLGNATVFGLSAALGGVVSLFAARRLSVQESPGLAFVAVVLVVGSWSLWVVGPVLGLAAAVLVVLGLREGEFESVTA